MSDFKPGLEGVIAFETEIAEPDKEGGSLRYRGVDSEGLIGQVSFVNGWALLVDRKFGPGLPPAEPFPVKYERVGNRVKVDRWVLDTPVPPYFRLLGCFDKSERVDRWMNTLFSPPAFVRIDIGAARAGTGAREGNRSEAATTWNLNAITPETEKTTHYFWAQAQDFSKDDPSIADLDFQLVHGAFLEDLKVIAGQQENLDLRPDAPRVNMVNDTGGLMACRILSDLIRQEQNGVRSTFQDRPVINPVVP
jgi:hypothetical protein